MDFAALGCGERRFVAQADCVDDGSIYPKCEQVLARAGFFDAAINRFKAQFGINGDPERAAPAAAGGGQEVDATAPGRGERREHIPKSNTRGRITLRSRTSVVFANM